MADAIILQAKSHSAKSQSANQESAKSQPRVSKEPLKNSLKSPQRTSEIIAFGANALVVLVTF